MTAERLSTLYRVQLAHDLTPPISRQTSELAWYYLLREATKQAGGTLETPDDETWIWSDLHLGDDTAIEHGNRPFENTEAMNGALLDAWRTCVDADHTIVNLGDVTRAMTPWRKSAGTLRALPGRKIVVLGNHDFTGRGGVPDLGEDELHVTMISPGEPTLLLTHLPMHKVPGGMVNVHGHSHRADENQSGPDVNVCVERTGYRPIRMSEIRERAKKLTRQATSVRHSASLESG